MDLTKRFLLFKTLKAYQQVKDQIPSTALVFIKENSTIYVNGEIFGLDTLYNLDELLSNTSDTELASSDSISQAVIKLYLALKESNQTTNQLVQVLTDNSIELELNLQEQIDSIDKVVAASLNDIVNASLYKTFSVDFSTDAKTATWFNVEKYPITILSISSVNCSKVLLNQSEDIEGVVIDSNSVAVFDIEREAEDVSAAIGVNFKVNKE